MACEVPGQYLAGHEPGIAFHFRRYRFCVDLGSIKVRNFLPCNFVALITSNGTVEVANFLALTMILTPDSWNHSDHRLGPTGPVFQILDGPALKWDVKAARNHVYKKGQPVILPWANNVRIDAPPTAYCMQKSVHRKMPKLPVKWAYIDTAITGRNFPKYAQENITMYFEDNTIPAMTWYAFRVQLHGYMSPPPWIVFYIDSVSWKDGITAAIFARFIVHNDVSSIRSSKGLVALTNRSIISVSKTHQKRTK